MDRRAGRYDLAHVHCKTLENSRSVYRCGAAGHEAHAVSPPRPPDGIAGTRVLVTGAHGFLGRFVAEALEAAGAAVVQQPTHDEIELRDPGAVRHAFKALAPQIVIHLAARVGGIGANQLQPGTFWRDNTLMGVNVLEGARECGARRLVAVGTVCAYPKLTPVPFQESELWAGYPEPVGHITTGIVIWHFRDPQAMSPSFEMT